MDTNHDAQLSEAAKCNAQPVQEESESDPQELQAGEFGPAKGALVSAGWEEHGGQACMVPVSLPDFGEEQLSPEESGAARGVLDVTVRGIAWALQGHKDNRIRLAALALLFGLFKSQSDAAQAVGVNRAAMCQASHALLEVLRDGK